MAEIKRYNNLETQTLEGEWVKHSDHLAAIRAAVAAERETHIAFVEETAQALRKSNLHEAAASMEATAVAWRNRARGAAHD